MVITILSLASIFYLQNGFANDLCRDIEHHQNLMSLHGMNYANAETTRTPQGGAYLRWFHPLSTSRGNPLQPRAGSPPLRGGEQDRVAARSAVR